MEKLHFSINIDASKEKVWNTLWDKDTYEKWTSVFGEGSTVITDWKEGDKVLFLDGKGSGMYSVIEQKTQNKSMSFKHLGMVKDNKEQPLDEESKKWSGAVESYLLTENKNATTLDVDIDITDDMSGYFKETFPKALYLVKNLSEN